MNKKQIAVVHTVLTLVIIFLFVRPCRVDDKLNEQYKKELEGNVDNVVTVYIPTSPSVTVTTEPTPSPTCTPTFQPTVPPTPVLTATFTPTPVPKPVESNNHSFKPYTGYWAYDLRSSKQYQLQQIAETDPETGIRVVKDKAGYYRYCVALGTHWAGAHPKDIGRCVDVIMENGAVLKCVLADVKRTEDTINGENKYGRTNNDILEFIVDDRKISQAVKNSGNVSNAGKKFEGEVSQIIAYDTIFVTDDFGN